MEEEHRHENSESTPDFDLVIRLRCLLSTNINTAKALALAKLEEAAGNGTLWREVKLKNLLYLWEKWGDEDAKARLSTALTELTSSDEGALQLLQGFLMSHSSATSGIGSREIHRNWDISPVELNHFGVLEAIRIILPNLQQRLEQELQVLSSEANFDAVPPTKRREWAAIHLTQYSLKQYDQRRYRDLSGLLEETVLDELRALRRGLHQH